VSGVDAVRLAPDVETVRLPQQPAGAVGLRQTDCRCVAPERGPLGRRRIGVFLGTSTSGILQTELAYRRRDPATGTLPDDF